MTTNEEIVKEFDKWFNHGTKNEPRFAYASGVYKEVQAFLLEKLNQRTEEIFYDIRANYPVMTPLRLVELESKYLTTTEEKEE